MLKKLLKYDMSRMMRIWKLYAILLPCLALALALAIRFIGSDMFFDDEINISVDLFLGFTIAICGGAIIVAMVFNSVFLAKYMGRDFFSDAGQLTFTLPIKRDDLFLSKFLNSLIWVTASNVSVILTVFLCLLIGPKSEGEIINTEVLEEIFAFFTMASGGIFFFRFEFVLLAIIIIEINILMPNLLNWCVIKCQSSGGMGMYIGLMIGGVSGVTIFGAICANGLDLVLSNISDAAHTAFTVLSLLAAVLVLAIVNFSLFFDARDRMKYNFNLT